MIDGTKQLVRPAVTVIVVCSFCAAALMGETPVESLKDFTLVVVSFWFAGRQAQKENGDDGNGGS